MNETKRRAIVWETIERIAFRPSSDNDRRAWLSVYAKTLHALWGMEPMWDRFALNDNFDIPFLMLKCDYSIESVAKYSVLLTHACSGSCYWELHVDPGFLSKASLHSANKRYPRLQPAARLQGDIAAVLDGLFFHPRCHMHLENFVVGLDPNSGGLPFHEIRIGNGIENPYVFLFHLRYQFCLVSDQARDNEKMRLIDLFKRSIGDNQNVNASDLFNFKR